MKSVGDTKFNIRYEPYSVSVVFDGSHYVILVVETSHYHGYLKKSKNHGLIIIYVNQ